MDELTERNIQEIARILEKSKLRLEDHFRCLDSGAVFTKAALRMLAHRGFDFAPAVGVDSLIGIGIDRSGGFRHPLTERITEDINGNPEPMTNLWGVASGIISGANGWIIANREVCLAMAVEAVKTVDLKLDAMGLLYQARYSDPALMRLAMIVHDGLEIKCEEAFNER